MKDAVLFITFEGIEGCGKTTQVQRLEKLIERHGIPLVTTLEPGGTGIGANIRRILLDTENKKLAPLAELLLYTADRAQHIEEVIRPALNEGKWVICDRFFDATKAYQGTARGLAPELIEDLHRMTCDALRPDLTFLLDLPPAIGLQRAWRQIRSGSRTDLETRFEKEKLVFHERVRSAYLNLAHLEPQRFRIIDAGSDKEQVTAQIIGALDTHMAARKG